VDEWFGFDYQGTAGERCDVAVTLKLRELPEFTELSRARIQALIEAGGVMYDGKVAPRGQKNLRPDMHVEVNLTVLRRLLKPPAPADIEPLDIPLTLHHVDEYLVVVEKPPGLSVHPSPTEPDEPTLTAALLYRFSRLSDQGGADRPGIVHRLDKETSGLLVVARDNPTHVAISRQFEQRLVEKEYAAVCIDVPEPPAGSIDAPIERHPRHRQKMWAGGFGRQAHTEYRLAEQWGPMALLDISILTGRTHQIRVHLQTLGAAILGDDKYGEGRNAALRKWLRDGGTASGRQAWRAAWPSREVQRELLTLLENYPGIFLHARCLGFIHPATEQHLSFTSALPQAWSKLQPLCQLAGESQSG